jgi:peptide deformylase
MIRKVLRDGDPRLARVADPVAQFDTAQLHKLVQDLQDTLRAHKGLGLAAPQLGVGLRVLVFRDPDASAAHRDVVLVNPVITPVGETTCLAVEACLSVPGRWGDVRRYERVQVVARDAAGRAVEREFHGMAARILQHEIDHLEGVLFPQRMASGLSNPSVVPAAAPR